MDKTKTEMGKLGGSVGLTMEVSEIEKNYMEKYLVTS